MPPSDSQPQKIGPALGEGGFEPYVRAVRRHPIVVAAVALATVAGAGLWTVARPRHYQATSQVLVTPAPFDDITYIGLPVIRDTSSDPARGIQTAAAMLDSSGAARATAQGLGRSWSAGRVRAAVTVVPIGGTNVLAVQAAGDQPRLAARIVDTFVGAALKQHRAALMSTATALIAQLKAAPRPPPAAQIGRLLAVSQGFDPTFSLLHAAAPPASPTGQPAWQILTLALFVGIVIGIGVAVLIDVAFRRDQAGAGVVKLARRDVSGHTDVPLR